jgi:acyl-CoA synthetase (AMP-forming)/AMP-acid ligase II
VAVVGRPHPELGEEVVAVIVAKSAVEPAALTAFCRSRLQAAKVPAHIVLTDALARTAAGKVRRPEVAELAGRLLAAAQVGRASP